MYYFENPWKAVQLAVVAPFVNFLWAGLLSKAVGGFKRESGKM